MHVLQATQQFDCNSAIVSAAVTPFLKFSAPAMLSVMRSGSGRPPRRKGDMSSSSEPWAHSSLLNTLHIASQRARHAHDYDDGATVFEASEAAYNFIVL
jgi:hypothetical protein